MKLYKIIGNMTGNSMDAIDLVLTEFDGNVIHDICSYSKPYSAKMQQNIESLRTNVFNKTPAEITALPDFRKIHDEYIHGIAACINAMCKKYKIDKQTIDAIGFHGKTLDHNPPSKAKVEGAMPYTLQIGSGKMLADLTGIPVVYDFRSDFIMNGFDGAPLVAPHNAHISETEGDGCYYNGGNTSNFALVLNGKAVLSADAGPFNEYTDNFVRTHTTKAFDVDALFGRKGKLNKALLQKMFDLGRTYYEMSLPKSGDPAYYHKEKVFEYVSNNSISFEDAVHTFEYFAAYIAAQALTLVPREISLPSHMILFGGGWKNPIVRQSFEELLCGTGFVLPEHEQAFAALNARFLQAPQLNLSGLGEYMEARLFADLARYKLENMAWEVPEVITAEKKIVCGCIAYPEKKRNAYDDCICRAAKGWQTHL